MEVNYIRQMNAFIERSAGVLSAKEQAMYLRLFGIWNKAMRPSWIDVADSQLADELKIGSRLTIRNARKELKQKGFIDYVSLGYKEKIKYQLFVLYDENEWSENDHLEDVEWSENDHSMVKKCSLNGQKLTTAIKRKDKSIYAAAGASSEKIKNAKKSEAVNLYVENIEPTAKAEVYEEMYDLVETYGEEWAGEAVREAIRSRGRSVKYVATILERWSAEGFKSERTVRNGRKTAGGNRRGSYRSAEEEAGKWAGADDRAREHGWDVVS